MAKKKYVKPMMVSEAFVPNEYVAACAWEVGTELTATCKGSNVTIKLAMSQGNDVWTATPMNNDGTYAGGSEMLYPIGNGEYAYCGSITTGHTTHTEGEYKPIGNGVTGNPGEEQNGYILCDCKLTGQSGALVTSAHHHLTNVKSKNVS